MNLLAKNQGVSISPSKIRGRTPPPPGGRWHEVPEEGEWAGALMLPRWSALGGIDAPQLPLIQEGELSISSLFLSNSR